MRMRQVQRGAVVGLAAATTLFAGAALAFADTPNGGSAEAKGAYVDLKLLGQQVVQAGPFAAASTDSGKKHDTFAGVDLPGVLSTGVINTAADQDGNGHFRAGASIVDAKVDLLKSVALIKAHVIEASCDANAQGQVAGVTKLTDIDLGKLGKVPVNPAANTVINVGLGDATIAKITLNEQIRNQDGGLTVNAVHIQLLGDALKTLGEGNVVLSSVTCTPTGQPVTTTPAPTTSTTTVTTTTPAPVQVVVKPVGAPQTGAGTLANVVANERF